MKRVENSIWNSGPADARGMYWVGKGEGQGVLWLEVGVTVPFWDTVNTNGKNCAVPNAVHLLQSQDYCLDGEDS